MMWLLQALAALAYLASLAFIVVIVNFVVLAVALWIRALLHSSPRARAGVDVPPSAPAPAGRIEPEWWLR